MLSTAAWNAFLKTLEEPPPNTVFVLATTEAQKVPATVVDRCHRFDFHRPTVEQIASVVRRTAQAESIEIPPEAVAALARSATGSFRDALGTLEQLVTYSGSEIALEDVLAVLGVADAGLLEETVDAVAAGDAPARAADALLLRRAGARRGRVRLRPRGARARAAGGAEPREVPAELSLTPEADAALRAQAERVEHAGGRAPARAARRGDGGRARRRRPAHAPGAGAREGREARGGRIDAGAARADRASGGRRIEAPAQAVAAPAARIGARALTPTMRPEAHGEPTWPASARRAAGRRGGADERRSRARAGRPRRRAEAPVAEAPRPSPSRSRRATLESIDRAVAGGRRAGRRRARAVRGGDHRSAGRWRCPART